MSTTNLKEGVKMRRKKRENTEMDKTITSSNDLLDDSVEQHFGSTQDIPSDEDVKEADNLYKDINETHKERTRDLQKQFRSRSREDVRSELKSSKARTKARLEASMRSGTQDKDSVDQNVDIMDGGVAEDADKESPKNEKADDKTDNETVEKKPTMTASERKALQISKLQAKKSARQVSTLDTLPTDMDNTLSQSNVPVRRFRGQRDAQQTTRFDEVSTMDEKSFRSQISTQSEVGKEAIWEDLRDKGWYTEKDSVDFFTRHWEAEAESTSKAADSKDDNVVAVNPEDANESTKLLEKPMERLYKSSLDFVVIPRRDYTPHETRVEIERDFLFVPAAVELTIEEKMGPEFKPRNREEEGFYVGKRPMIAKRNEQRLESRFLKENRTTWFGDDGKVKIQPDPLKEVPFRPLIWDEQDNPMPDYLQAEYKEPLLIDFENRTSGANNLINSDACWQLDVDLHSLSFRHHHLFSKEHVLANRLSELIKRLDAAVTLNWESYCDQRLLALKHAINTLLRQVEDNRDAVSRGNVFAEQMTRIREYRAQVTETRRSRNCAGMLRKQLVRAALRTWKQLKRHRQAVNFTNTNLVLEIRKLSWSHAEDEAAFLGAIEEEISEERDTFEEMFKVAVEEYDVALQKFEEQKAAKEAAAIREEMREEVRQNTTAAGQLSQPLDADKYDEWEKQRILEEILKDQDYAILAEPDLIEPEEPIPFNEVEVRKSITERVSNSRRLPGEPEIQLKLGNTATITPDSLCPAGEARRRRSLASFNYFLKIFINHKFVLSTDVKELGSNFTINFNIIYPIQIFSYPEIISVQLWEKHGFKSRQLSEVTLPTPDNLLTLGKAHIKPFEFISSVLQKHTHEGIGSGVNFAFDGQVSSTLTSKDLEIAALSQLLIAGYVTAALGWSEDESGQPLAAPPQGPSAVNYADLSNEDPIGALGAVDALDEEKLTKWVLKAELDPNDPNNARLLRLLKPVAGSGNVRVHAPEYFRLNHEQEKFSFCQEEELQKNPRFRMIMYRDQEKEGFKNIRIPLLEKEITPDIFKELQERRSKKPKETLRGFEMRKALHEQYVSRIRAKVLEKARQALHSKSLKDVVREEEVPGLIALLPAIAGIFKANRPLRPERTERKAVPAVNIHAIDVRLLVTLNSARNVPLRKEKDVGIVCPYVEVSFQEETKKTTVSSGPNPSWNTELPFNFRPPPHISNLESVVDIVHINLFDEVRIEQVVEQQGRTNETRVLVEKRWLGGFHIPFTTVYLNTSIEGTFRLDTPPLLLGYVSSSSVNNEDMNPQLNVFITLDPLIRPPEPVKEKFDSQEDHQQLERAEAWLALIKKQYPDREIKCTVVNQNCLEVFVTRFLSPLEPPPDLLSLIGADDLKKSAEILARYVAHIPFESDALAFPGLCDIWSTCEQFMHLLQGDEEEHAVLLCNFFLHLYAKNPGFQVYLALGRSIPEGASSFVMVHEDAGDCVWLWTSTGLCYDARKDPRCPVRSIGCVITHDNILANIQMSEDPKSLNYDFTNPKFWRACFKPREAESLLTIQKARLDYLEPLERDIEDYKFKIEKVLRERFMEWRKGWVTKWNRQLMRQLNSILEKLEKNCGKQSSEIDNFLNEITKRYDMCGFPMNMHYLEIDEIVGRVHGTGIHMTNTPGVEFALSVYIKAYRGGVLSIWIYATSLVLKRR